MAETTITAADGKTLVVRSLCPSMLFDVHTALGAEAAAVPQNIALAVPVLCVVSVDGVPVPKLKTYAQVLQIADKIGFEGIAAVQIQMAVSSTSEGVKDDAKNV